MNLDGYALPIKKLKGTEPVKSIDLSSKRLGVASAIVIAALIQGNGSLTQVLAFHDSSLATCCLSLSALLCLSIAGRPLKQSLMWPLERV